MPENQTWSVEAEKDFIRGLGEWNERSRIEGRPYEYWLDLYIMAHEDSDRAYYIAGVLYAKKLIATGFAEKLRGK